MKVRMAVVDEDIWPEPSITEKLPADPKNRVGFTDFINSRRVDYPEMVKKCTTIPTRLLVQMCRYQTSKPSRIDISY